jgi:hypothetical protein
MPKQRHIVSREFQPLCYLLMGQLRHKLKKRMKSTTEPGLFLIRIQQDIFFNTGTVLSGLLREAKCTCRRGLLILPTDRPSPTPATIAEPFLVGLHHSTSWRLLIIFPTLARSTA